MYLPSPEWMKEIEPAVRERLISDDWTGIGSLVGVMLGLFDHCRTTMEDEDWQYVLRQLRKELDRELKERDANETL